MINKVIDTISCPHCGHKQNITIWGVVDASVNTKTKQKILNGTFFEQICKSCGEPHLVSYPMLYEDKANRLMIYHNTTQLGISNAQEAIDSRRKVVAEKDDMRIRIVTSPNYLREKLRIFEMGLDDRIVEVVKALVLEKLCKEKDLGPVEDVLCWVHNNGDMDIDVFAEQTGSVTVNKSFYSYVEGKVKRQLDEQYPNPSEVNLGFAIEFLDRNHFVCE